MRVCVVGGAQHIDLQACFDRTNTGSTLSQFVRKDSAESPMLIHPGLETIHVQTAPPFIRLQISSQIQYSESDSVESDSVESVSVALISTSSMCTLVEGVG